MVGYNPEGDACCALTYTYTYTYDVHTGKQVSQAEAGQNGRGFILKDPWSDTANNGMYARIAERGDIIEIFPSAEATGGAPRVITPSNPYSDPARGKEASGLYTGMMSVVRFSPDGRYLAAGTGGSWSDYNSDIAPEHAVHIWDTSRWRETRVLTEPRYQVSALAWSPDSRYLAAAGGRDSRDNVVRVWDTSSWRLTNELAEHNAVVSALDWSPDGRYLASLDITGLAVIWRAPR